MPGSFVSYMKLLIESMNMVFGVTCAEIKTFPPILGMDIDPEISSIFFGKSYVAIRKTVPGETEFFFRNPENHRAYNPLSCASTGIR